MPRCEGDSSSREPPLIDTGGHSSNNVDTVSLTLRSSLVRYRHLLLLIPLLTGMVAVLGPPGGVACAIPSVVSPLQGVNRPEPVPVTSTLVIPVELLRESWEQYKQRFIQEDGRVVDRKARGISTSEGQSYALMRAVWMGDRQTFDRVLKWTGDNLQALALIRAHGQWAEKAYLEQATALLNDIWEKETVELKGVRYLLPGDWDFNAEPIRLNPSYYLPFAYRVFDRVDPNRGWRRLVDSSYTVLNACLSHVGLPADWCFLDPGLGTLSLNTDLYDRSSDSGYEAFRVYWNLAADYRWHGEKRALELLGKADWLRRYFAVRRDLPAVVTVDGIPRESHEYPGQYGAYLPALALMDDLHANLLYRQKIEPSYHSGLWGEPDDYYQQNWMWFGLALQAEAARGQPSASSSDPR